MKSNTLTTEAQYMVRDLPRGEYVKRKQGAKKVYIRGDYDSGSKRYSLLDVEDIGREIWVRGDTHVWAGFTY